MIFIFSIFLFSFICISNANQHSLSAFNFWFNQKNEIADVQLEAKEGSYGLGVFSDEKIKEGQTLIQWPLTNVLCKPTLTKLKGRWGSVLKKVFKAFPRDESTGISLALMLAKNSASERFRPWVDVLPEKFNGILFFKQKHIELQSNDVQSTILSSQSNIQKSFEKCTELLNEEGIELNDFPMTLDNWKWANSMVNSRAWTLHGTRYFVPMADMFNYAPHESEFKADYSFKQRGDLFASTHVREGKTLKIIADRDTNANEEIFETYGDNPSKIYFLYHGFVPKINPFNCVNIPIELSFEPQNDPKRVAILQQLQVPRKSTYCILPRNRMSYGIEKDSKYPIFPQWLIDLTNVNRLDDEKVEQLTKNKRYFWKADVLAASNSKTVQMYVHRMAKKALTMYKTSLVDDRKQLEELSDDGDALMRLSLEYLVTQKSILVDWIIPDPKSVSDWKARHNVDDDPRLKQEL